MGSSYLEGIEKTGDRGMHFLPRERAIMVGDLDSGEVRFKVFERQTLDGIPGLHACLSTGRGVRAVCRRRRSVHAALTVGDACVGRSRRLRWLRGALAVGRTVAAQLDSRHDGRFSDAI